MFGIKIKYKDSKQLTNNKEDGYQYKTYLKIDKQTESSRL